MFAAVVAAAVAAAPHCPNNKTADPHATEFCIYPVYGGGTCINPATQQCCSAERPDGMSGVVCPKDK
eukprot:gene52880-30029_t